MNRKNHKTEKPRRNLLKFFIVIVIAILVVWQWSVISKQYLKGHQAVETFFHDIDALGQKRRALMAEVAATQQTAKERLDQYATKLTESQKKQHSLNKVSADSQQDALKKIEQQIIFADQYLELGGNVKAAHQALNKALLYLQQTQNDELASLEDNLIDNIESLTTPSLIDASEIVLQLNDFGSKVDELPLLAKENLTDVNIEMPKSAPIINDSWFKFIGEIWQDGITFINVQKASDPEIQILSPSQNYFLQENLKLKFLLMRFSLLSGDWSRFNADLEAAIGWIKQYYDTESAPVTSLLQALIRLQESETRFEIPDISASLDKIHNYRIKRKEENK